MKGQLEKPYEIKTLEDQMLLRLCSNFAVNLQMRKEDKPFVWLRKPPANCEMLLKICTGMLPLKELKSPYAYIENPNNCQTLIFGLLRRMLIKY